jgi:hypothetical protein
MRTTMISELKNIGIDLMDNGLLVLAQPDLHGQPDLSCKSIDDFLVFLAALADPRLLIRGQSFAICFAQSNFTHWQCAVLRNPKFHSKRY